MRPKNGVRPLTAALLVLVLGSGPLAGRPAPVQERPARGDAVKDFIADTGRIWTAPFRLKNRHVGPLIILAAATSFLIVADEDVRDAFQGYVDGHAWVNDVGSAATRMGGLGAFATAGLFFGAGLIFKDERARDTGYLAGSAMIQSFLVSHVLKGFTGRQRPYYEDGADHWAGPVGFFKRYEKANEGLYDSFPSGHAATVFSLATVVALQYRHRTWVPVLAYTLAAGVGLSRVTEDSHWMSDVVVGALLGHFIARLVVHNHEKRRRLVPILGCAGRSVTLGFYYALDPAY